jgi:hypothetical protein
MTSCQGQALSVQLRSGNHCLDVSCTYDAMSQTCVNSFS